MLSLDLVIGIKYSIDSFHHIICKITTGLLATHRGQQRVTGVRIGFYRKLRLHNRLLFKGNPTQRLLERSTKFLLIYQTVSSLHKPAREYNSPCFTSWTSYNP